MLIKFTFIVLVNAWVCNAFYGYTYPNFGMMPPYNPYMPNPYQGQPYMGPEIIDLPASAEDTGEIFVTEEVLPNTNDRNESQSNSTATLKPLSGKPLSESNNKTAVPTSIKTSTTNIKDDKSKIPSGSQISTPFNKPPSAETPNSRSPYSDVPFYGGSPFVGAPYGGMPYGGAPYAGIPFGGSAFGGMPYGAMPYGGMPYGGIPFGGNPYATPYGGMPYPGNPYSGYPFGIPSNNMQRNDPSSGTPEGISAGESNSQTTIKPLLDPNVPPYPYSPPPSFKVIKQGTSESIRDIVRGPVKTSSLTLSEPSKTVVTRTIDSKTGEVIVKVNNENVKNEENNDVAKSIIDKVPEVNKTNTKRTSTFRARTK